MSYDDSDERYNSPSNDASPMRSSLVFHVDWSESLFLAALFGAIAILLPAFFYFISGGAVQDHRETRSGDHGAMTISSDTPPGEGHTPLSAHVLFILSAAYRALAPSSIIVLRPLTVLLSFMWAPLYPVFLVVQLLFRATIILPWRIFSGLVAYFYPVYVFGVVAVALSAIVGLAGRMAVQAGRWWLVSPGERHARRPRGKKLR